MGKSNEQIIKENSAFIELLDLITIDIIRIKLEKNNGPIQFKDGKAIRDYKTGQEVKDEVIKINRNYIKGLKERIKEIKNG